MWMKDQIEKQKEPSRLLQENANHLSLHPCMTMEQENTDRIDSTGQQTGCN